LLASSKTRTLWGRIYSRWDAQHSPANPQAEPVVRLAIEIAPTGKAESNYECASAEKKKRGRGRVFSLLAGNQKKPSGLMS
ncbi:hypothetical protein NG726_14260, partial [Pseudomonas sp. MOB-449]|nr:hypothetical protein [Pseudomonas sp. MOB-449]